MKRLKKILRKNDQGFTMLEIVVVMVMTSILAGIFAEIVVSGMEIYTTLNFRKTAHADIRRGMDTAIRDLREFLSWDAAATSTNLQFEKINHYETTGWFGSEYYDEGRSRLTLSGNDLLYRREYTYDRDNIWGSAFPLINGDINGGSSSFTVSSVDGNDLITIKIAMTVNNSPIVMQTAVFPRKQGG